MHKYGKSVRDILEIAVAVKEKQNEKRRWFVKEYQILYKMLYARDSRRNPI